jgi:3-phenylpropionate/trans-cinnamate dioxygenase ferredoxin reductase subunit|tara:strand:- start:585 stop:1796 length:1212 start_codon:yes stop_codon:yes gene_type:complete
MKNDVVIIGAGHAGGMAAISLRQRKYQGSITLVGEERFFPYQRPALSKGFLSGELGEKTLYLKSEDYFEKKKINVLRNSKVIAIDRSQKTLLLENQKQLGYKQLIIATGSVVNQLRITNREDVYYLRTIGDSLRIRKKLKNHKKITIIGAGYIGLEIASIAVKKNLEVKIVELENRVMGRVVSSEVSDFFQKKHQAEGVEFKFNSSITGIEPQGQQKRILCSDGSSFNTDFVVVGVGIQPNIELAESSGLRCNNGILVNDHGQTSDASVFAVGDCSNQPNKLFKKRLRLESVSNAVEQARSVAASIAGIQTGDQEVPWFWSDQYNLKLQIAGISQDHDHRVIRGCLEEEKFAVFYEKEKRLIAVDAINSPKEFMIGKKWIAMQAEIPFELIRNMDIDLKEISM